MTDSLDDDLPDIEIPVFEAGSVLMWSGNGWVSNPYPNMDQDELEERRREVFDRWTWETGSKDDAEELGRIDAEIEARKKAPKYSFTSDTDTGIYFKDGGKIGISVGGIDITKDKK